MVERPALFNGEMVNAILAGRKTQTRRLMKIQPPPGWCPVNSLGVADLSGRTYTMGVIDRHGCLQAGPEVYGVADETWGAVSPFGKPGDRLWVRETWWQAGYSYPTYPGDDEYSWHGSRRVHYAADGNPPNEPNCDYPKGLYNGAFSAAEPNRVWRKRPSIHMPRWASRIQLEITGVRIERLNDISHEDAELEGIHHEVWDQTVVARNYSTQNDFFQFWDEGLPHYVEMDELYRASFRSLWQSIYGDESWNGNPWVWVFEFQKVQC